MPAIIGPLNGGEKEPEQRTADRLQGLGHTGAFLEQDVSRIALALQQLGRQCSAHLGGQVRLRVPPNRIARDAEALCDGPASKSLVAIARSICGRAGCLQIVQRSPTVRFIGEFS